MYGLGTSPNLGSRRPRNEVSRRSCADCETRSAGEEKVTGLKGVTTLKRGGIAAETGCHDKCGFADSRNQKPETSLLVPDSISLRNAVGFTVRD